jgi:putative ABC transport system permease protein
VAALALRRAIAPLLFGVSAPDPLTFAVAISVLLAATLIASAQPAQRAARLDPTRALTSD